MKTLVLHFYSWGDTCNHLKHLIGTELSTAVWNNIHLHSVEVQFSLKIYQDEREKYDDKECCTLLNRYCKCNQKLQQAFEEADSIPLSVWPYVYHLTCRGGANMLYWHLHQHIGYLLNGGCTVQPNLQETMLGHACMQSTISTNGKGKHKCT